MGFGYQRVVGGLLGVASGADDKFVVTAQACEPAFDVSGVVFARSLFQPQRAADHGAAKFGNQFLKGISFAAEIAGQVTVQALGFVSVRNCTSERLEVASVLRAL